MRGNVLSSPWGIALMVGLAGWAVGAFAEFGALTPQSALVAYTVLLLAYLAVETLRLHRIVPERWLLNPAVLSSAVTFTLGFGITNVLYFFPEEALSAVGLAPEVTPWMSKLMLLVLIGALAMWLGYWSPLAASLAAWLSKRRWLDRILRRDFNPRAGVLAVLVLVSLASRLIQIRLGIYGYSADYDRLIETASIRQYFNMTDGLGKLALVIVSLQYYSPNPPARAKVWLAGLLACEICFGFLSGFKSEVAMPVIIVGACKYLRLGQVPWRWVALLPVAFIAAYAVIQPLRAARYEETGFRGTSLTSIAETVLAAAVTGQGETLDSEQAGTALQFLSRTTMTYIASLGIEFADTRPLPEGSPAFMQDIFLAPLYAVIPRALWESKEGSRHGLWYRNEVMEIAGETTSVGMSPFTYLYFAGGGLAVALGFIAVGIIQRVWAERFLVSGTAGAIIVFLVGIRLLAIPDSVFYSMIVDLLRFVPAAVILQYVTFRR